MSPTKSVETDAFFSEAPAPLAVLQGDGTIARANDAFIRAMSDGASVVGLSFASLLREADRDRASAALLSPDSTTFEASPIARAEPTPRTIRFTVGRSSTGLVNVVGVEVPASPRDGRIAQLEEELREQSIVNERQAATLQVFSQLLDTAPVIVWAVDTDGTYTMYEGKGLELIGSHPGQAVGENALRMQEGKPEIVRAISAAMDGELSRFTTYPREGVIFDSWFMPLYRHDGTVSAMGLSIDVSERVSREQELRDKLDLITQQSATIRALATPIIRIWDDVLCLPIIGVVDNARASEMMQSLLATVSSHDVGYAILDVTGVDHVDTATADHLIKLLGAVKLSGVTGVLCGISPSVAQTMVALGLELRSLPTKRTLREALKWCIEDHEANAL